MEREKSKLRKSNIVLQRERNGEDSEEEGMRRRKKEMSCCVDKYL